METFLQEFSVFELAFFMLFSLGIALFYTLVISVFFGTEKIPSWFFFVLLPSILLAVFLIANQYTAFALLVFFAFLVVLIIVGMVYRSVSGLKTTFKKRRKKESTSSILISVLKSIVIMLVTGGLFFLLGRYIFIAIPLFIAFQYIISPSSQSRFLRLQASLPTSKMRSMAMGLVEVRGKTKTIEPLISRIKKRECIGYRYTVESEHRDKDGDVSYSTISDEVVCNPFILVDETGEVHIEPEGIDFYWLELSDRYRGNSKRYSQYLLLANAEVLLIGKASSKKNKNIIERENIKSVFALAPINSVTRWNRFKPLLNSMLTYATVLLVFVGFILLASVEIKEESIVFSLPSLSDTMKTFDIKEFLNSAYE